MFFRRKDSGVPDLIPTNTRFQREGPPRSPAYTPPRRSLADRSYRDRSYPDRAGIVFLGCLAFQIIWMMISFAKWL